MADDLALPPGSWHPGMSSRLGEFKLVEMGGSHEVMFTRPAELPGQAHRGFARLTLVMQNLPLATASTTVAGLHLGRAWAATVVRWQVEWQVLQPVHPA